MQCTRRCPLSSISGHCGCKTPKDFGQCPAHDLCTRFVHSKGGSPTASNPRAGVGRRGRRVADHQRSRKPCGNGTHQRGRTDHKSQDDGAVAPVKYSPSPLRGRYQRGALLPADPSPSSQIRAEQGNCDGWAALTPGTALLFLVPVSAIGLRCGCAWSKIPCSSIRPNTPDPLVTRMGESRSSAQRLRLFLVGGPRRQGKRQYPGVIFTPKITPKFFLLRTQLSAERNFSSAVICTPLNEGKRKRQYGRNATPFETTVACISEACSHVVDANTTAPGSPLAGSGDRDWA